MIYFEVDYEYNDQRTYMLHHGGTNAGNIQLTRATVTTGVDSFGAMSFSLSRNHPYAQYLTVMLGRINVRRGFGTSAKLMFRGRITRIDRDMFGNYDVECEGAAAELNDIVYPNYYTFPTNFNDVPTDGNAPRYMLSHLLSVQNNWKVLDLPSQEGSSFRTTFYTGNCTVLRDHLNYKVDKPLTVAEHLELLRDKAEGHYVFRYSGTSSIYVDFFVNPQETNKQKIVFGLNALNIESQKSFDDFYTGVYITGKKISDEEGYVNLFGETSAVYSGYSINGMGIYVRNDIASQYGLIVKYHELPSEDSKTMLKQACRDLLSSVKLSHNVKASFIDLSYVNSYKWDQIEVGKIVTVEDRVNGLDGYDFMITGMTVDLIDPKNSTIELGTRLVGISRYIKTFK